MLKPRAFTLIELLLSLSLFAIILCFSLPFFSFMQQKNQIQIIQDDIKSAIRFARSQALMTGENVILTALPDAGDWSHGILLSVDNVQHHDMHDSKSIHEWHWQSPHISVVWRGFQSNHYLLFSADMSQNATNGAFVIRSNSHEEVKLVVNRLGRVRLGSNWQQPLA